MLLQFVMIFTEQKLREEFNLLYQFGKNKNRQKNKKLIVRNVEVTRQNIGIRND